jgi:uncharacterized OB-fold protein
MTEALATPYREGILRKELLVQRCGVCGRSQLPPLYRCAECGSDQQLNWISASGRGTVVSFTLLHRAPGPEFEKRLPYIYALVELEEGPRIVTNLVHVAPDEASVGQPVVVVFERIDEEGHVWPEFAPATAVLEPHTR